MWMNTLNLGVDFEVGRVQVSVCEEVEMAFVDDGTTLVCSFVREVVCAGNVSFDFEVNQTIVRLDLFESQALIAAAVGVIATILAIIQMDYCLSLPAIVIIHHCYYVVRCFLIITIIKTL